MRNQMVTSEITNINELIIVSRTFSLISENRTELKSLGHLNFGLGSQIPEFFDKIPLRIACLGFVTRILMP